MTISNLMKTITLKRSEWECYIDTPDDVLDKVNSFFTLLLADSDDAINTQSVMYRYLGVYSEWGFCGSECNEVVTQTINKYYGTKLDRWSCLAF